MKPIHVIGGGLAGCEAAYAVAQAGVPVVLHEMRPQRATAAHRTPYLAELVCSNSFRSDDAETNAVGVLHREMRRLGSLVMRAADAHQVPAGGALAVDRDGFAQAVEAAILAEPLITLERDEITALPPQDWGPTIIATGPLTSPAFGRGDPGRDRRTGARLLRRHRTRRALRQHRFRRGLAPVALRQGRSRRRRRGLRQLPHEPRAIRRLRRCAAGGAKRPSSASSRARPISTAACRSRSWPSAAARLCATAR